SGHKFGDSRATGTPLSSQSRDQGDVDVGADYGSYAGGLFSVRAWDARQDEHQRSTTIRNPSTTAGCPTPPTVARQCEDSSVAALIPSHDWGGSALWTRTALVGLESFSVGGDFRHYQGAFDEVDFNTSCPGANCGRFVRKIWSGGDQNLSGAFVQAIAVPLAKLRVELGLRAD